MTICIDKETLKKTLDEQKSEKLVRVEVDFEDISDVDDSDIGQVFAEFYHRYGVNDLIMGLSSDKKIQLIKDLKSDLFGYCDENEIFLELFGQMEYHEQRKLLDALEAHYPNEETIKAHLAFLNEQNSTIKTF